MYHTWYHTNNVAYETYNYGLNLYGNTKKMDDENTMTNM